MLQVVRRYKGLTVLSLLILSFSSLALACGEGKECDGKSPSVSKATGTGNRAPASMTEAPRLQQAFVQAPAWQTDLGATLEMNRGAKQGDGQVRIPWTLRGQEAPSLGWQNTSDSFVKRLYFRN